MSNFGELVLKSKFVGDRWAAKSQHVVQRHPAISVKHRVPVGKRDLNGKGK